jgi:hypothetical protein
MRTWPDDNAHCDRADCPKALQCIRHQALISKRRAGVNGRVVINDFNPVNCSDFVEAMEWNE